MSGLTRPVARILRHGTGPAARRSATEEADRLWEQGVAARAVFRPEYGGWAVLVFTAPVRERPRPRPPEGPRARPPED
ncbi:hypothetical protein NX794_21095 [Streptomyces sp. LP11]|uniref:Uncharacterized protein n=1 Tax=Streptomyces pyxinicus TaxID=2970331 RepID=A0ABT2B5I4_9ACTN|nr:hypothetical protein [Streptomyces sp. LP11]MCS0603692.1 hypothetical protein [Streptomyces sp. LP11]